jgi:hypothetical protein
LSIPTPHAGQAFSKEQGAEADGAGDAIRPVFIDKIGNFSITHGSDSFAEG